MEDNKPKGRVNPTSQVPPNPAKKFIQWSSADKCFKYFDKSKGEKGENVLIQLPFTFIPLDRAVCFKGWNDDDKISYISNEIPELGKGVFTVRAYNNVTKKSHVEMVGTHEKIKTQLEAKDIKYTESIYVGIKGADNKLELANLQLNGSGLMHWFKFVKDNDIWSIAASVSSYTDEKKGSVKYTAPKFSPVKIKEETDAEAAVLQEQIRAYLAEYYARSSNNVSNSTETSESSHLNEDSSVSEAAKSSASEGVHSSFDLNDDDLPF